jgi:TrmH family RNA methyltransferase
MGTILRTADWFGFEQIIVDEDTADIYNPKVVRASMGSIFRVNVHRVENLKQFIEENFPLHKLLGTFIESGKILKDIEITDKIGILFGNESKGISKSMERILNTKIHIDGFGNAESLNVAVASGIILYEIANKLNINNTKL